MARRPLYLSTDGRSFTPEEFVEEYNRHATIADAAKALGISARRCSLIAHRLRKRGHKARWYGGNRMTRTCDEV